MVVYSRPLPRHACDTLSARKHAVCASNLQNREDAPSKAIDV
jgi:hypothetical protein